MKEIDRLDQKYKSSLHYILSGLIPYTEANAKLSFKPNAFFNDLEKLDRVKTNKKSLKTTYYRAIKKGFIKLDYKKTPRLTPKGELKLKFYEPKKLDNAQLMIIFDIPEAQRAKRSQLRTLLRELKFRQVQKSVWVSAYDSREYLLSEIDQHNLQNYVKIYEASPL